MERTLNQKAERIAAASHGRKLRQRLLAVPAARVVFCTA